MKRLGIVALALVVAGVSCSEGNRPDSGSGANGLESEDGDGGLAGGDAGTAAEASATPGIVAAFSKTVLRTDRLDPNLINPWGLAFNETAGPAWIANAGTGTSSVVGADNELLLTVVVPAPPAVEKAAPTGIAFNGNPDAFMGDAFVFVTEDGAVAGWQQEGGASLRFDNSASQAIYKGATIAADAAGEPKLYATNFHAGRIDVYDKDYAPVQLAEGAFVDTTLPPGYAPFNADAVGNLILVTYALQDAEARDDVKGAGNGLLDVFDTEGVFLSRLAESGGTLNAPWGLAVTPDDYGPLPHRLLVGNFGDGRINVFDVELAQGGLRAAFEGQLGDTQGAPLAIEGLWALRFPTGPGFDPSQLHFTAGPGDEEHGEYGHLDLVVPTEDAGAPDAGEDAEAPDAGGGGEDAEAPDAGGAGEDAEAPDAGEPTPPVEEDAGEPTPPVEEDAGTPVEPVEPPLVDETPPAP